MLVTWCNPLQLRKVYQPEKVPGFDGQNAQETVLGADRKED